MPPKTRNPNRKIIPGPKPKFFPKETYDGRSGSDIKGGDISKTLSDNFLASVGSEEPVQHIKGEKGEKGFTIVRSDGPFRTLVAALRWKFYLAPGFSKDAIERWNEHRLPTTTNVRLATVILLPARHGQSGFTIQHEALLRMVHNRKAVTTHIKPFARKMEWVEACIRENIWLQDRKWSIRSPDLSDSEDGGSSRGAEDEAGARGPTK